MSYTKKPLNMKLRKSIAAAAFLVFANLSLSSAGIVRDFPTGGKRSVLLDSIQPDVQALDTGNEETLFQQIPRDERNDEVRTQLENVPQSIARDAPISEEESEMATPWTAQKTQSITVDKRDPIKCLLSPVACY